MTYLDHFKLDEPPFRLTPDPDFIYMSKQHTRAKSYMGSTIWFDDGFVIITGEVGSGKTTLLQSFIGELDKDTACAVISQTQLTPTQFLEAALHEFGLDPFNKSKVQLLTMMSDFLIEQYANGKKVVLIVDEAQNLGWKVLEEIRLLSGIESHKDKVLRIILVGQPELKDTLNSPQLKQLMQRVRCKLHLGPLSEVETTEYVAHRLRIAGNDNEALIKPDAFPEIFKYTGGVPRLINTLCDTAFLCAFAEDRHELTKHDVLSAVDELGWQEPEMETTGTIQTPYLNRLASSELTPDSVLRIDVRQNGKVITEHFLPYGKATVGRSAQADICIQSKYVSRLHAEILSSGDGIFIRDLNSTNGLGVRGDRIREYRIKDRDVISLGKFDLVFTDLRTAEDADEDSAFQETLTE